MVAIETGKTTIVTAEALWMTNHDIVIHLWQDCPSEESSHSSKFQEVPSSPAYT